MSSEDELYKNNNENKCDFDYCGQDYVKTCTICDLNFCGEHVVANNHGCDSESPIYNTENNDQPSHDEEDRDDSFNRFDKNKNNVVKKSTTSHRYSVGHKFFTSVGSPPRLSRPLLSSNKSSSSSLHYDQSLSNSYQYHQDSSQNNIYTDNEESVGESLLQMHRGRGNISSTEQNTTIRSKIQHVSRFKLARTIWSTERLFSAEADFEFDKETRVKKQKDACFKFMNTSFRHVYSQSQSHGKLSGLLR